MSAAQIMAAMSGDHNIVIVRLPFVQWTGSLEAAMLLDKVLYWWRTVDCRPFYKSDDEWVKEIPGATRYAVRQARDRLAAMGILVVRMDRHPSLPSKVAWYSIDEEAFDRSFNEWGGFNSRVSENEQLNAVAPSVDRNRTVEDPETNGRGCESEQSLKEDASSTTSKTSSSAAADAAEDAGEAARSAAAAGHANAGLAVVLVDAEPEPLTLAGAVALVAFGHADATVPTKHLVEYDKAVRLLGQGGYSADDVLDADDHWRRAYERRHDRQPTSARVTQVVQHCAEWRLATQPEGPLFDRAAYGRPDDDGAPLPAWPPPADPAPLPPTTAQDLWQRTLTALQLQMTRATFDAWLKRTRAIELDGDTLVVEVPNAATRDWLTSRLANAMRDAVATVAGPDVAWRFVVAEREAVVA